MNLNLTEKQFQERKAELLEHEKLLNAQSMFLKLQWRMLRAKRKRLLRKMEELDLQHCASSMSAPLVDEPRDQEYEQFMAQCESIMDRYRRRFSMDGSEALAVQSSGQLTNKNT